MSQVHKLQPSPKAVAPILLKSAAGLGLDATINDPVGGHFEFRTDPGGSGKAARIAIEVTDDGFGSTSLHVEVTPPSSWSGKRAARRLVRRARQDAERAG
jgi:hypothetical protein